MCVCREADGSFFSIFSPRFIFRPNLLFWARKGARGEAVKIPTRQEKKRCCRTPVLEEDPELHKPFFKSTQDDPSNSAYGMTLPHLLPHRLLQPSPSEAFLPDPRSLFPMLPRSLQAAAMCKSPIAGRPAQTLPIYNCHHCIDQWKLVEYLRKFNCLENTTISKHPLVTVEA